MDNFGDRLLNRLIEASKGWGEVANDEAAANRKLLSRRSAFYKARKEAFDYVQSLERTIKGGEEEIAKLHGALTNHMSALRQSDKENESLKIDLSKLRKDALVPAENAQHSGDMG